MKKYYLISAVIFIVAYITAQLGKLIFGGETKLPTWLAILFIGVMLNSLICATIYIIKEWRN